MTSSPRGRLATLGTLRDDAAGCRECPLGARATQTVWGEGQACAPLILVGEQPGDLEDMAGRPFVGPAGQLLDRALDAWVADLDQATCALAARPPAKATTRSAPKPERAAPSRPRSTAAV